MARRREDRIKAELQVRVWGMTAEGRPFNEHLKTRDVSRFGARIAWPACPLKLGDIVGVQYQSEKARFRIAWIAANKSEFGVAVAEPGKSIWGPLPTPAASVSSLRAASAPPAAAPAPPAPPPRQQERRRHHRLPCQGGVQIRMPDGSTIWGTLSDISEGGCYIETAGALTMGTESELTLKVADMELRCRGKVRTSHPGIGAGISFTFLSAEARKQLNQLLDVLVGGATPAAAPAPTVEGKIHITSRVYKSAEELRILETLMQSNTADVDPRILAEFRNAVDHARQAAWAVQTWIELRKQKRDPFSLMPLVEKRRIRHAIFLMQELLMDYQSLAVTVETEGFGDLKRAVTDFHRAIEK
jgi:hypothetical protein